MARCRCSAEMCTCQIEAGLGVIVAGSGSIGTPFTISTRIDYTGGTTGQVLALGSDGNYHPANPATTAPGAIVTGLGLDGDGSVAAPLEVRLCSYGELKSLCA